MHIGRAAALLYAAVSAGVIAFQFALAAGAPWGSYGWAADFLDSFPPALRIAALVQAALIAGMAARLYQCTAIDDCTRLRVLKVYTRATSAPRFDSSTKCGTGCRSASTWCRPTTVRSFSCSSTGTSRAWISAMFTSAPEPRI